MHFDKFSGAAVNQPGNYQNGAGGGGGPYDAPFGNGSGPYRSDGPPPPPPFALGPHPPGHPLAFQQAFPPSSSAQLRDLQRPPSSSTAPTSRFNVPALYQHSLPGPSATGEGGGDEARTEALSREFGQSSGGSRPGTAQAPIGSPSLNGQLRPGVPDAASSSSPLASESTRANGMTDSKDGHERGTEDGDGRDGEGAETIARNKPTSTKTSPSLSRQNAAVPSRIAMPPPLPFSSIHGGGVGGGGGGGPISAGGGGAAGPFSPMRTNLPPMTPSMPAFTFGGFSAPTPPVHPHALFSPGIGPFSPQIGSPFFGAGHQQQGMPHFQTVAPGSLLFSISFQPSHGSASVADCGSVGADSFVFFFSRGAESRLWIQSHVSRVSADAERGPSVPNADAATTLASAAAAAAATTATATEWVPDRERRRSSDASRFASSQHPCR